jgi:aspartate-semialdehyde dehydrogenase
MSSQGYRVAVVGATGQVGTLMLQLLRERAFPANEIVPFASERSVGRVLVGAAPDGGDLTVQGLSDEYRSVTRRLATVGSLLSAIVLVTILFMVTKP